MRSRGEYTTNPQGATMKPNPKISAAVAAILWAPGATMVFAAPAGTAAGTGTGGELQEVVVTAERRAENLQDVPITVQAITGDQLKQLSVTSFNDLMKYTPNVSFSGNGPGTGNIFMRGLGGVGSGNQSQSTTAPFPNVALYLDEQSMQFPARNNDVYLIDMERVEILEGPQGTLFGGGAQAGAIRYITNKPQLGGVSGDANAGYGITTHGDPNTMANAVLNVPLTDTFAPGYSKDKYESTAWTLNGKLGDLLSLVYTGSYMVRHIDGQQDYSNYMRSFSGSYYACIGTGAGYFNPGNFPQLAGHPLQCS